MGRPAAPIYLYHGDAFEILPALTRQGLDIQLICTDPPFSSTTHDGHDKGSAGLGRATLGYACWAKSHVERFCRELAPLARGWCCVISDDVLGTDWRLNFRNLAGRQDFAPIPCIIPGSRVRFQGDGPPMVWYPLYVARPRRAEFIGGWAPRGYYFSEWGSGERGGDVIGNKPIGLMSAIISDYYSRSMGSFVVDPCCGSGTSCAAASLLGIPSIGIEVDPVALSLAADRCRGLGAAVTVYG